MITRPRSWSADRSAVVLVASIALVLLCWILGTPRSGGPDEPSHMVASAALVRGERAGDVVPWDSALRSFEVPAMVGRPDPACWVLQPEVPVDCAPLLVVSTADTTAVTTSANYPPWAYALPGVASYVPWAQGYTYLARALMAVVPLALLVGALRRVRPIGRGATVGVWIGLTPIAWFSMTIVNPSAVAIAGGLALWAALLVPRSTAPDVLLVAGAAGVLLARRDGPVWATLIVLAVCLALGRRPADVLARPHRAVRVALPLLALVPVVTVLLQGFRDLNVALACAPFGLVVVDAAVRRYTRLSQRRHRVAFAVAATAVPVAVLTFAASLRPGGLDGSVIMLIVTNTGEHLRQLVGVLGWVDTPVPTSAILAVWAALGALGALAYLDQVRIAAAGAAALFATVVTAWLLEFGQGADYGRYWQGRYSMPIFVGIPLLLAIRAPRTRGAAVIGALSVARVARPLLVVVWAVLNFGFAAALHRWGVGVTGTWSPTSWHTWDAPVAPVLLVLVHAAASAAMLVASLHRTADATTGAETETEPDTAARLLTGGPAR